MRKSLLLILSIVMVVMMTLFGCSTTSNPPENNPSENNPPVNNGPEVTTPEDNGFELNYTEYRLSVGQEVELCVIDKPELEVTWSVANEQIAKVENGKVTALNEGATLIKAKAADVEKSCRIFVTATEMPSRIHLEAPSTLMVSKSEKLNVFFDFAKVTNNLVWEMPTNTYAALDADGNITALSEGEVEVTAKYTHSDGKVYTTTSKITIVIHTEIKFVENSVTLGSSITISGDTNEANATYKPELEVKLGGIDKDVTTLDVKFRSVDEEVVTVDQDGTVHAVNSGEAQIIATYNGVKANINIYVRDVIASKKDLDVLGYAAKNNPSLLKADKYYVLTQDIDYNDAELVPIAMNNTLSGQGEWGRSDYENLNPDWVTFAATLDGNGHVIKNAYLPSMIMVSKENPFTFSSFIGKHTGTVKNIGFINLRTKLIADEETEFGTDCTKTFDYYGDQTAGSGLIGINEGGTIENIYLEMKIYKKSYPAGYESGALVGTANSGVIKNCIVQAEKDYTVENFTNNASYPVDWGAAIGCKNGANVTITNVFAVSSSLTTFIAKDNLLNTQLYQDSATFINGNKDTVNSMGELWEVKNGSLFFGGKMVIYSSESNSIEFAKSNIELYTPFSLSGTPNAINTSIATQVSVVIDNEPVDVSSITLQYSSTNTNVADVDVNGNITAKRAGAAKISATYNGVKGTVTVTVRDVISSKADLDILGYATKNNDTALLAADKYYVLTNDIDYADAELVPIAANPGAFVGNMRYGRQDYDDFNPYFLTFSATLDGKGHVIKNAYIPSTVMVLGATSGNDNMAFTQGAAFIGKNTGTVKNIGFTNLRTKLVADETQKFNTTKAANSDVEFNKITDTVIFSGLVGINQGTLENIYLDMKIYKKNYGSDYASGALVAHAEMGSIKNCIVKSEKDYTVSGYKEFTGTASHVLDFGAAIGKHGTATVTNVFAVSSSLTKFIAKGTAPTDTALYTSVAGLINAKSDTINTFGVYWSLSGGQLKFGDTVIS